MKTKKNQNLKKAPYVDEKNENLLIPIDNKKNNNRNRYTLLYKKTNCGKNLRMSVLIPGLGKRKIAEILGIDSHTLREWIQLFPFIEAAKNISEFYLLESGGSLQETLNIETELIKWISKVRHLDIAINTLKIIIQAIKYIQI